MIWNRKKVGITAAAVAAAAAIAGGGVAIAHAQENGQSTPSATSTASPTSGSSGKAAKGTKGTKDKGSFQAALAKLKGVQHAQWVTTEGASGTSVTHDAIRGAVTAVSPSSITVRASDGVSQSYGLTSTTRITVRGAKGTKPSSGTAASVTSGATVIVTGTGTSTLTADRVVVPPA